MELLKNKNVIGGIVLVIVLALTYYIWTSGGKSELLSSSEGVSPLSQEILATLTQLQTLHLDPALFKDPVFVSLNDYGVTIPPQNAGRQNPFAPVGSASRTSSSTPAR